MLAQRRMLPTTSIERPTTTNPPPDTRHHPIYASTTHYPQPQPPRHIQFLFSTTTTNTTSSISTDQPARCLRLANNCNSPCCEDRPYKHVDSRLTATTQQSSWNYQQPPRPARPPRVRASSPPPPIHPVYLCLLSQMGLRNPVLTCTRCRCIKFESESPISEVLPRALLVHPTKPCPPSPCLNNVQGPLTCATMAYDQLLFAIRRLRILN